MEEELERKRLFAMIRTGGFVIGFTIIFMIMGSSASFLGKIFIKNKIIFSKISGGLINLFGLSMMGILKFNFLNLEKRATAPKKIKNWFSSILMGMAFAAGWTPCFGPVLASILIYAGSANTVSKGVNLLFVYSLGMALPFMLTALFINTFTRLLEKADKFLKYMPMISGIIMVVFGVLIFFDKVVVISRFLL